MEFCFIWCSLILAGDNSAPYPFVFELWDFVTNEIATIPHPPKYNETRFFRPRISTWDDNTFLLMPSQIHPDDAVSEDAYLYRVGEGWIELGKSPYPLDERDLYGHYMLNNPDYPAFPSLNRCALK